MPIAKPRGSVPALGCKILNRNSRRSSDATTAVAAAVASTMRAAIHSLEARTNDGAAPNQEEIFPNIKRATPPTNHPEPSDQPNSRSLARSLPLSAVISHPLLFLSLLP